MSEDIYSNLKQLGGATRIPTSPEEAELERVANPQADVTYNVRFTAP
ncbi:NADPH-dependent 7-cyano-7-deazaguanine reductase QueF, partial [Rhodovulum sulfidophilum]|nr:NADPH-dependent 7-cyano-7-deazaguanine reductase QueF [Rhodovulum sulfidophilum]